MATEQRLNTIVINKVENKAVYDNMLSRGLVKDDEFYLVDDSEEIKVKSVNGNTPNADGDVTLTASDVGASASDHNHDDRYYTESETNALLNSKANSSDLNNYLPLSGGTVDGSIKTTSVSYPNFESQIAIGSYTNGADLVLLGKDASANAGKFYLRASDGNNSKSLVGYPNGVLVWDAKDISCIDSSGTNYIRYTNGLQICWGRWSTNVTIDTTQGGIYYGVVPTLPTFPVPFTENPAINVNHVNGSAIYCACCAIGVSYTNITHLAFYRGSAISNATISLNYTAIGRWK